MRKINNLLSFLALLLLVFATQQLSATCTIDNTGMPQANLFPVGSSLVGTISGQSFTACESNKLVSIQIETSGGDIDLYLVKGNSGALNGSPVYQTYSNMPNGIITLTLATPLDVYSGELISFGIEGPAQIRLDINPTMAPVGRVEEILFFINGGTITPQPASDMFFKATIATPAQPAQPLIPTMSQWGLMIFGLLILNLGAIFIRQSERLIIQ